MERLTPAAEAVWDELVEGNARFRRGTPLNHIYTLEELQGLAVSQHPKVGIIACSDSRVSPDVVFDQPLGTVFSSRVPGNVASDSARWMLDLAVGEFHVPLVIVMAHTGCLAVGQLLDGDHGGSGGMHRFTVLNAVYRAKAKRPDDVYTAAIEENAIQTIEELLRSQYILRSAIIEGRTSIMAAVYEMETGNIRRLEVTTGLYGKF